MLSIVTIVTIIPRILDTGATNHVTGENSKLCDLHETLCPIRLPYGPHVVATKCDRV